MLHVQDVHTPMTNHGIYTADAYMNVSSFDSSSDGVVAHACISTVVLRVQVGVHTYEQTTQHVYNICTQTCMREYICAHSAATHDELAVCVCASIYTWSVAGASSCINL
jgi:hypothetical protein